jgi:hypothetical protein
MAFDRPGLFAAIRPFAPGGKLAADHVPMIDALADKFGLPRVGQIPNAPVTELTEQDFKDAAAALGCSVAQIRAVFEVEASGAGWFTDVRADILALDGPGGFIDGDLPKILFEAHHFDRLTGGKYRKTHPNLSSAKWNRALYVGGQGEWARLYKAMTLDRQAALMSASWGGPQIMGFNHKLAGFSTVDAFVDAMMTGSRAHLMAFVNFVKNSGLAPALRQITGVHASAVPFARGYNGAGYAKNEYHIKIARAFAKWNK